jgi:hypothetical protein
MSFSALLFQNRRKTLYLTMIKNGRDARILSGNSRMFHMAFSYPLGKRRKHGLISGYTYIAKPLLYSFLKPYDSYKNRFPRLKPGIPAVKKTMLFRQPVYHAAAPVFTILSHSIWRPSFFRPRA